MHFLIEKRVEKRVGKRIKMNFGYYVNYNGQLTSARNWAENKYCLPSTS